MQKINKIITVVLFYTAALMACNGNDTDSNTDDTDSNVIAQYANIDFAKQEYQVPLELIYNKQGTEILYDRLYPIGWSKNGLFAYIVEPADEGSGLYWFELIILDIVNNKVAWSWKPSETSEGNIASIWKENYELFKKHLGESEVIQLNSFALKSGKTSYKGNDYEIKLDASKETDPDFGFDVIKKVEIRLVSKELGEKEVYNQKSIDYSLILGAYVPGYLLSPFDDRIVVIYQKERVGYEGPPNVVFFDLIGSDLIRGFKKDKDS